ncbi:hypothetical protein ILUMI_09639 [Ignelater luminosus]|uniref:Uncharacterized protein n=1 Tax=Ignelater luminosus TaxID=2038154 RepID=A0A8K0GEV7_IGNLU|nr:hypothetical protein ILUMI_09639 [Ignelater luminosus]
MACTNRLVYHAASLVKNMTTNTAENYNSVLEKFIGGKRIKRSHHKVKYKAKQKTTTKFIDADEDYGPNLQMSEIGEKDLKDLKEKFMQKLNKTADEIMSISQLTLQQNNSAV